jgi:LPS-assembly lipoprotein
VKRRLVLIIGAVTALCSLSGCGFKLRGPQLMSFTSFYSSFGPNSVVGADLNRLLKSQGQIRVETDPTKAQIRMMVQFDGRERDIVGYSATGRPREYQLRQRLRYQLLNSKADPLGTPIELVVRRDISTTDAEQNAKQQEEELLYKEMEADLVDQVLRRLGALQNLPAL